MAGSEVYRVRAQALRDYANQLASELEGPFPKGLREHGAGAVRYLRTYAADTLYLGEQIAFARELADTLSEILPWADRADAGAHPQVIERARALLGRAEQELKR